MSDKILFCLNSYLVFYAELEININRFFTQNSREQWSLLFVDYNFMPPVYIHNTKLNPKTSAQRYFFQPHILTILHNAKVKYCCLSCRYEWTTARGRAIFQGEKPEANKYNVLFAYLFPQKCQICRKDTEPSWYLDETTRVMKSVCRILNEEFYSDRQFLSPPSSSSSSSSLDQEEECEQRFSAMRNSHPQHLCRACQQGSCYTSQWFYQRKR